MLQKLTKKQHEETVANVTSMQLHSYMNRVIKIHITYIFLSLTTLVNRSLL